MPLISPPRVESTFPVRDKRQLSYAEYGPVDGRTFVWLHGTPGGRRQIPQEARQVAEARNLRIIGVDRPGIGKSTPHIYPSILEFAHDLALLLDHVEAREVGIIGLSGGGPYALAMGHAFPDRVKVVGVLGGVAPTRGDDSVPGGAISLATRLAPVLPLLRVPLSLLLASIPWVLRPVASQVFDLYARISPEGDQRVFAEPEIKAMFLDDLLTNTRRRFSAPVADIILFTRHWGFALGDVNVPVHWWHGDADNLVPLEHAHYVVPRLRRATLSVRPGESHLGSLGAAEEVLGHLVATWDASEPSTSAAP